MRRRIITTAAAALSVLAAAVPAHAANGRIYYADDWTSTAWSVDPAGTYDRNEALGTSYSVNQLAVSPDGTKIAYANTVTGKSQIWVVGDNGAGAVNTSTSTGTDSLPSWAA